MFTMAKIRDGSTYLGRHLCANDYYSEHERIEGRWIGQAVSLLGLDEPGRRSIGPRDLAFEALRNNRRPDQPDQKLTPRDKADRVAFFDFQCSAQKSVSIMAVAMDDRRLYEAHDRAAAKAFGELERFAATRVRDGGAAWSNSNRLTGNVCAAAFRHDASRALDPQIHTHFVVANTTWDAERGRWAALSEYEMVKAIRYAGKVYQNEMAREIQQLGYDIEEVRQKGQVSDFEIKGVDREICQRFSKRRADIEKGIAEFIKDRGRDPTTGEKHVIATSTRSAKLDEITTPEVRAAQRAQLTALEMRSLEQLKVKAMEKAQMTAMRTPDGNALEAISQATRHLFERKSVALGHEILADSLNADLGRLDLDALKEGLRSAKAALVNLSVDPGSPALLGSREALSDSFATIEGLRLEKWAVEFVNRTQSSASMLGPRGFRPSQDLSTEQRQAVLEVLGQRDVVYALRGVAGAGKTTTLGEINRGLEAAGRRVIYAAPTSAAAKVLKAEGFSNATTVTDFLQNVSRSEKLDGAVFIVDEAGLQSNRQGADVLKLAEKNGARVLFVGDTRQHSGVEAGDFLRVLETHSRIRTSTLRDVRRQTVSEYNQAVRAMAGGQVAAGMEQLAQLGWIKEGKAEYIRAAAEDYLRLTDDGQNQERAILVTPTWAENDRVTQEIRERLKERGVLGNGQEMELVRSLKWTAAQKATVKNYEPGQVILFHQHAGKFRKGQSCQVLRVDEGKVIVETQNGKEEILPLRSVQSFDVAQKRLVELAPGDKVQLLANDRKHGLVNGDVLVVEKIERDGSIACEGGKVIPAEFRQLTHGYAVTSHKSQGRTADAVIVCAERLDAKAAYVGCSRGRELCIVHTPDQARLFEGLPRSGERKAALDLLREKAAVVPDSPALRGRLQAWKEIAVELGRKAIHAKDVLQEFIQKRLPPSYSQRSHQKDRGMELGD